LIIRDRLLGRGSWGKVFMGVRKSDGKKVAIKEVPVSSMPPSARATLEQEAEAVKELCPHPRLVGHLGSYGTPGMLIICLELCVGGDVGKYLDSLKGSHEPMDQRQIAKWTYNALEGLQYMENCGWVHRDIKPSNLLLTGVDALDIRITDFGLARRLGKGKFLPGDGLGTLAYMAPERHAKSLPYSHVADVFSVGIIMATCANNGRHPFVDDSTTPHSLDLERLKQGGHGAPGLGEQGFFESLFGSSANELNLSEHGRHLVLALMEPDPVKRYKVGDALRHPWFVMCSVATPVFRSTN